MQLKQSAAALTILAGLLTPPAAAEAETGGGFIEGVYATEDGCAALAETPFEQIDSMRFIMLTPNLLIHQEYGCRLGAASPLDGAGAGWRVAAECAYESGTETGELTVVPQPDGRLVVSIKTGSRPDTLGTFFHCPKVAKQP